MTTALTIDAEDRQSPPFFSKVPVSIERGEGVYVWDEDGNRYLDFTAGWGVTCLGHAHPVITDALLEQSRKIVQNPNSGLTYSPVRARLLSLMGRILPSGLTRIFFSNSGAEANDAVIKLARKVTARPDVVSAEGSFHGRTISTTSATGQAGHRDRYNPLMPHYRFVPYDDLTALEGCLDDRVAAVILEPIQGEGGVKLPGADYIREVSRLCRANGTLLIMDEVQTGFCRCGPMFVTGSIDMTPDFLTMAKGIAGGYPFGAFAMTEEISARLDRGDHGGTYCGNPLGCAVSLAVISHLIEHDISSNVQRMGGLAFDRACLWKRACPQIITDVRGMGLLLAVEFRDEETAAHIVDECFAKRMFVRQTQRTMIRLFPALNITREEMEEGLAILEEAINTLR